MKKCSQREQISQGHMVSKCERLFQSLSKPLSQPQWQARVGYPVGTQWKLVVLPRIWSSLSISWAHRECVSPIGLPKGVKLSLCNLHFLYPVNILEISLLQTASEIPLLQDLSFCSENCGRKFLSCWYVRIEFIITSRSDVRSCTKDLVNNMTLAGAHSSLWGPGMSKREYTEVMAGSPA